MTAPSRLSLHALGTLAVLATTDPHALPPARRIMVRALRRLDLACSRFRRDSELVALNQAAGGRPAPVGEVLWEALEAALHAARITGGLVDPTVGRALRAVGYDRTFVQVRLREGRFVPSFEPGGRWRELELDARRRTVRVPAGVELDLGATAKAHAADRIAREAFESTGAGVIVSLGGDVAVAGRPPEGGWGVRIGDDSGAALGEAGPVVTVSHGGLASSGTRVRRWRGDGGELHHVIDPLTGRPARTPWSTVTVAAASCLDANAATTAAIVLGERAPAWLAERSLPARLARSGAPALCVGGWPAEEAAA